MQYESVNQALEALKKHQDTMAAYNHALGVLFHDGSTVAPKESWAGRGQTMGVMSQITYDLETKPENVVIYATSNRRHLIRENFSDKQEIREDMHTGDTVQEKLSLVARFGVSIYFGAPTKKEFDQIVVALAQRNGIDMGQEELLLEANKWELSHGGRTGRTAQQFIDYLLGIEENL